MLYLINNYFTQKVVEPPETGGLLEKGCQDRK